MACAGGSSRVFKSALAADLLNWWHSSIMKILYFDLTGENLIPSINSLTSSTPVCEAASISIKSIDFDCIISRQESHLLHGSKEDRSWQLIALAKRRAIVVLPLPLGPVNKYACEIALPEIELVNVCTICSCPIISEKLCGLYLRYKTKLFTPVEEF